MLLKITSLVSFLILSVPAYSAVFNISSGDVTGLIAAINAANANGEENTINLAPGTYTLNAVDNGTSGNGNGLPVITSAMTITGGSAETTIIQRDPAATLFRIFSIQGTVTINGLTIRGGRVLPPGGGGIVNSGRLTINHSIIDHNSAYVGGAIANLGILTLSHTLILNNGATFEGGAILNLGTASIISSTVASNGAQGGIVVNLASDSLMTIQNSTIRDNSSDFIIIGNSPRNIGATAGTMTIVDSTIANNRIDDFASAAVSNSSGTLDITNSTISGNVPHPIFERGFAGIDNFQGLLRLQNTIVADNGTQLGDDCSGPVTSLGNNIIGRPGRCDITLLPSDLTADPGLDAFIDDGTPGGGRFPLLPGSPAIDAGNDTACPATDQLETPRRGRCDIGAVEFYPVVNDLVALANVKTDFDPTPVPNGLAGTFRITAEFTNTSTQVIGHRFAEVVELAGKNLLLNADGGTGGVGARLTIPSSASTPLLPGATETVEFVIGLQLQEPFTFLVNMIGDPQI